MLCNYANLSIYGMVFMQGQSEVCMSKLLVVRVCYCCLGIFRRGLLHLSALTSVTNVVQVLSKFLSFFVQEIVTKVLHTDGCTCIVVVMMCICVGGGGGGGVGW